MTSRTQTYLITPRIDDAEAFASILRATVERTRATSVLLRLSTCDERTAINRVKRLAPVAQALDAAVLVENEATIATRGGADGVLDGITVRRLLSAADAAGWSTTRPTVTVDELHEAD